MQKIKLILAILSIVITVINIIIFLLLFIFSKNAKNNTSLSFYKPEISEKLFTSATLVSVPNNSTVIWNPLEVNLNVGENIYYQISSAFEREQSNYLLTPLYDHKIININPTGFGIQITALKPGDTVIQVLTNNGIKDLIYLTVK